MSDEHCWSSIVSSAADRAALRLPQSGGWLLNCDLPPGHIGLHASDGGHGPVGRRPWLFWADYARTADGVREVDPCSGRAGQAVCEMFAGHPGAHRFPAPVRPPAPVHVPQRSHAASSYDDYVSGSFHAPVAPAPVHSPLSGPLPVQSAPPVSQSSAPQSVNGYRPQPYTGQSDPPAGARRHAAPSESLPAIAPHQIQPQAAQPAPERVPTPITRVPVSPEPARGLESLHVHAPSPGPLPPTESFAAVRAETLSRLLPGSPETAAAPEVPRSETWNEARLNGADQNDAHQNGARRSGAHQNGAHQIGVYQNGARHEPLSMLEVHADSGIEARSLIEVIDASRPAPAQVISPAVSAASVAVQEVERAIATLPDEEYIVRRQVGDALREVAQALDKLAGSLELDH
ncbi:MAG: hypothetical protein QM658_15135 [Gordonia sp. (in: high G+C Gram-positive bacteria)]